MHSLASTLAAHQKQPARTPALTLALSTKRFGSESLRWERWYTGAEGDAPVAAAIAGDGSLIRARNAAGSLYVSRVATPGSGSTYSSWTLLDAAATSGAGVALASRAGELLLLYVCNAGLDLVLRTSADNGATWSGATVLVTEGSAISSVAVAFGQVPDACAFYVLGTSTTLKRLRRTSGTWAVAGTNWSRSGSVATLSGVAASYGSGGDFELAVTGTAVTTTTRTVWGAVMGDVGLPTNAWSSLVPHVTADSSSTSSFSRPAIAQVLTDPRIAYTHTEAGAVAYSRTLTSHPAAGEDVTATSFAEPAPLEVDVAGGAALCASSADAFMVTAAGVWHAALGQAVTVSGLLTAASVRFSAESARALLTLDDTAGDVDVAHYAGGTAQLTLGYASGAGGAAEYGCVWNFTIDQVHRRVAGHRRTFVLECSGPWEAVARWRAPQAWQIAAAIESRDQVFRRLAGKAGVPVGSGGGGTDWTTLQPSFAISPGESGAAALKRLLSVATEAVRADDGIFRVLTLDTTSDYTYGPADHPVSALQLTTAPPPVSWARLQGTSRYAQTAHYASVARWGPVLEQARNLDATTDAAATTYAAAVLERARRLTPAGELTAPANAGQELWDVVTVTEPLLGLTAQKYRVIGLRIEYERGARARFDSILTLGELT